MLMFEGQTCSLFRAFTSNPSSRKIASQALRAFSMERLPQRVPKRVPHRIPIFTPQYNLRISYPLTYSLFSIWLVCEYHYTRAECLRLNKFEFLLLALSMKKPLPVSYYNGEDHETVFINE